MQLAPLRREARSLLWQTTSPRGLNPCHFHNSVNFTPLKIENQLSLFQYLEKKNPMILDACLGFNLWFKEIH
jgi:hypothetical protein